MMVETSPLLKSGTVPEIKGRGGSRPGAGRPPKDGVPRWKIAEAVGYSERTMGRVQEHVRLAEKFPFMQRPLWTRPMVLRVGKLLESLPDDEREAMVSRLETIE